MKKGYQPGGRISGDAIGPAIHYSGFFIPSSSPGVRLELNGDRFPVIHDGCHKLLINSALLARTCTMDNLSRFCCLNSDCPDQGRRGGENLSVCGHYGKQKQFRLLYCHSCKARFSERKGTPLFRSRLPQETVASILHHVAESNGVRKTERLVGVHRDTVTRYSRLAGSHAKDLHDELVALSPPDP